MRLNDGLEGLQIEVHGGSSYNTHQSFEISSSDAVVPAQETSRPYYIRAYSNSLYMIPAYVSNYTKLHLRSDELTYMNPHTPSKGGRVPIA